MGLRVTVRYLDFCLWITVLMRNVQALKIDPYLNTDAGLLNPLEYVHRDDATRLSDTDRLLGMESASYWPTAAVSCSADTCICRF